MNKIIERKKQKGATLVISLAVLFMMTLLGITAMRTTIFEEKMSHNMRNKDISFQAAESALVEAEAWVANLNVLPSIEASCSNFPCAMTHNPTRYLEDQNDTWWNNNSAQFSSATIAGVAAQPRYVIEFLRFVPDSKTLGSGTPSGTYYFRITSKGIGTTNDSVSFIETTTTRRF